VRAAGEHVVEEEDEMLLGVVPYTVIYPRAMMIHSSYACLASGAMMRVRRLYAIALLALLGHYFVKETNIPGIHDNRACWLWLPSLFLI
jgi:hypothetical protein